jgi:nucleoside-diphosphate-sugar epimerase
VASLLHNKLRTLRPHRTLTSSTLVTGWNDFFGSILCSRLDRKTEVTARCGRVEGSKIKADLAASAPDIKGHLKRVIHLAGATPGPSRSITIPDLFNIGNVLGTSNLLTGLTSDKPESFVLISSASVYGKITGNLIDESAHLLATSEYAKSKRDSEILVAEWCDKHNVDLTIVRLPLVVGVGAPRALGQLINAIRKRRFVIPGDGCARKSVTLATDVADWLVNNPSLRGTFNLTDQQDPTYAQVCDAITTHLKLNKVPRVPCSMMKAASWLGDSGGALLKKPLP